MSIASTTTTTGTIGTTNNRPPLANHVLPLPLATTRAITVKLPVQVPIGLYTALDW